MNKQITALMIFAGHKTAKRLGPRIYNKKSHNSTMKRQTIWLKNGQNILTDTS